MNEHQKIWFECWRNVATKKAHLKAKRYYTRNKTYNYVVCTITSPNGLVAMNYAYNQKQLIKGHPLRMKHIKENKRK